jgi:hypothetical protein
MPYPMQPIIIPAPSIVVERDDGLFQCGLDGMRLQGRCTVPRTEKSNP